MERQPWRLDGEPPDVGAVRRDRDVRHGERPRRDESPRGPEAKAAGDDQEHGDDEGRPARVAREDEHAERDDGDVHDEHHTRHGFEGREDAGRVKEPVHEGRIEQDESAETEHVDQPNVRKERTEEEEESGAAEASPVEGPLEAIRHGP